MQACDMIRVDPLLLHLRWRGNQLASITLRWSGPDDVTVLGSPWGELFQKSLKRYLAKEEPAWPDVPLSSEMLSAFAWKTLQRLRSLPPGAWVSYKQLAAESGKPGAARAVGRVMARNPWPLLFPCHRVLGRSGQLTGFGPGLDMKQYLLDHEGIEPALLSRRGS